jgi:hypothetical protein
MGRRAKGSKTENMTSSRNRMSRKEKRTRSKMTQCVKFHWSVLYKWRAVSNVVSVLSMLS